MLPASMYETMMSSVIFPRDSGVCGKAVLRGLSGRMTPRAQ